MLPRQRCAAGPGPLVLFVFFALSVSCSDKGDLGRRDRSSEPLSERDQLLLASTKMALPPAGITRADLPDFESSDAQRLGVKLRQASPQITTRPERRTTADVLAARRRGES